MKLVAGTAVTLPFAGWLAAPDGVDAAPSHTERILGPKTFNVKHYGATGDGHTNDAPAIQSVIDAASKHAKATVYFPAGAYAIERSLVISHPVRLVGAGMDATTIVDPYGMHIIELWNTHGVDIRGLTIQGAHGASDFGYAVRTNDVVDLNIQDCRFVNIPDTAVSLGYVRHASITNCQFQTIGNSGIRLQDPGDDSANHDIVIEHNTFTNVVTSLNRGHAAIQSQGGLARHERITVKDNIIDTHYVGIGLDSIDYGIVANNRVLGNGELGEGIAFTGSNTSITGNAINQCYAAGILQWAVSYRPNNDNIIEGNTCWNNGQGIAIICGEPGTLVESLLVTGNRCYSASVEHPQNYGIQSYINPTREFTWKNVAIVDNDLRGNAVGAINLAPPSEALVEDNLV